MKISAQTERSLLPSHRTCHRHVRVAIEAPEAPARGQRPPVNVAFVLDRSGSMGGGKFRLAQAAVEQAIARLDARDRFAVVVFDSELDLVFPSRPATGGARQEAVAALSRYRPRGSTDLGGGWLMGCGQVAEHLAAEAVGRCMLLTDGQANVGIVDPETLCHHARELRGRGVSTSTFGVGQDFYEHMLGPMADAGGGAFQYIESAEEIPRIMDRELGETLEVVARRVVLELSLPAGVTITALGPYDVELGPGLARVGLPDLVSAQLFELPIKLGLPAGPNGEDLRIGLRLLDAEGVLAGLEARLDFTWVSGEAAKAQPRDVAVDRFVAERYAARAMQEASRRNREGDYKGAAAAIEGVARRVRGYAGQDGQLQGVVQKLEEEAEAYRAPVTESKRKSDYARTQAATSSRDVTGQRQRWKS
ncbi:MAG: VWA domain-containing protein [Pseudomonadota bacterium]